MYIFSACFLRIYLAIDLSLSIQHFLDHGCYIKFKDCNMATKDLSVSQFSILQCHKDRVGGFIIHMMNTIWGIFAKVGQFVKSAYPNFMLNIP